MQSILHGNARVHEQQERYTRRARSPSIYEAFEEVLSETSVLFQGGVVPGSAASAQAKRIILELGRQHSGEAAYEAFQWLKGRAGGEALPSWYHACITACVWNGGLATALKLYHESTAAGHKCTLHVFNALIAACGRTGALDTAMEVLFCSKHSC